MAEISSHNIGTPNTTTATAATKASDPSHNDSYISHTSYNDSLQCSNNSRASYNGDYDYTYRYTGS